MNAPDPSQNYLNLAPQAQKGGLNPQLTMALLNGIFGGSSSASSADTTNTAQSPFDATTSTPAPTAASLIAQGAVGDMTQGNGFTSLAPTMSTDTGIGTGDISTSGFVPGVGAASTLTDPNSIIPSLNMSSGMGAIGIPDYLNSLIQGTQTNSGANNQMAAQATNSTLQNKDIKGGISI